MLGRPIAANNATNHCSFRQVAPKPAVAAVLRVVAEDKVMTLRHSHRIAALQKVFGSGMIGIGNLATQVSEGSAHSINENGTFDD